MNLLQWPLVLVSLLAAIWSAGHALLHKRDPHAALGWIAVCLMIPLAGPLLYLLLGINRIQTRARKMHSLLAGEPEAPPDDAVEPARESVPPEFAELARLSRAVTRQALAGHNSVEMLQNGEAAYPAMLEAIDTARRRVFLSTYIYETNATGLAFIEALDRARRRGVDVRVLLDGIGELYARPCASVLLRKRGIPAARFLPARLVPPAIHLNLRNHRKLLIADGATAFTGGMNIGDRHLADAPPRHRRVRDVHHRLRGPIVRQIEQVFIDDWRFAAGEQLQASPPDDADPAGPALCRTIVDGPNEDHDRLAMILLGAFAAARQSIRIMTPYFIPSRELIGALNAAALRGVEVTVILPAVNNIPLVHWATRKLLWQILEYGVAVYYQPAPFVHSKLLVVDQTYAQIGSANVDARSLRLNFEVTVEVYDVAFAATLARHIEDARALSHRVTLEDMDGRPLPLKLRDAAAWLLSPYL